MGHRVVATRASASRKGVVPVVTAALLAVLAGGCSSAPTTSAPPAPTTSTTTSATTTSTTSDPTVPVTSEGGWYLALGDSLAAGNQPTTGDQPTRGYPGPVLDGLRNKHPGIQLRNLGCSGETTTSMLKGGLCSYAEGSQLAAAVTFLRVNAETTHLVTLDMGANNVLRCARPTVDAACATRSTTTAATELGSIAQQVRAAAPNVEIVLLTYYNPLLAVWRQGAQWQPVAEQSQPLLDGLNTAIEDTARAVGAEVADVAGAFATSDTSGSPLPVNVQRICDWTWMCTRGDIHANDEGYAAMAKAVLSVV